MKVALCVVSFRRPQGLRRLLLALERLTFQRSDVPELEVVVVDNDAEGSAREVCEELRSGFRWPLRCEAEPRRGISFARNRAVEAALAGEADLVAFIDDDEEPEPDWLDELLVAMRAYDADVVTGPVEPRFEEDVPRWAIEGGFFASERYPDGYSVETVGTGNVLIRAAVFRKTRKWFDERLALTGGEDSEFFHRVRQAGGRVAWADNALAHEWIPASRARTGWLLRRAYRVGISSSIREREQYRTVQARAARVVKRVGRIGQQLLLLPVAALRGRRAALDSLRDICFRAGDLAGMAGVRYEEYRTTHGG